MVESQKSNEDDGVDAPKSSHIQTKWRYPAFIARSPWIVIGVTSFIVLALSAIAFLAVPFQVTAQGSFYARSEQISLNWDAFQDRNALTGSDIVLGERTASGFSLVMYYRAKDPNDDDANPNILTVSYLDRIKAIEDQITGHADYSKFCLLVNGACAPPSSLVTTIYQGQSSVSQPVIDAVVGGVAQDPGAKGFFLSKNYDSNGGQSTATRSVFTFGVPLPGYKNDKDRPLEQQQKYGEFINQFLPMLQDASQDDFQVAYQGNVITETELNELVFSDVFLVAASIGVVFIIIMLQTWSPTLATVAIVHILMSAPVSYFFYVIVFQIEWMTALNFIGLFVILGIGADNVFVYTDAWKQSRHMAEYQHDLELRVSYVWVRASKAMSITSLTTFVAFVATAISEIPTIRVFGIFSAVMVLINYVFVVTWYAAWIVVWNRLCEFKCCVPSLADTPPKVLIDGQANSELAPVKSFSKGDDAGSSADEGDAHAQDKKQKSSNPSSPRQNVRRNTTDEDTSVADDGGRRRYHDDIDASYGYGSSRSSVSVLSYGDASYTNSRRSSYQYSETGSEGGMSLDKDKDVESGGPGPMPQHGDGPNKDIDNIHDYRFIERMYYLRIAPLVYKGRWIILGIFVVIFGFSVWGATQLRPPDEQPTGLPTEHPITKIIEMDRDIFVPSAQTAQRPVYMVWGIDSIDRTGVDDNDPDKRGVTTFKADFGIRSSAEATLMDTACTTAATNSFLVDQTTSFLCPVQGFKAWRLAQPGVTDWTTATEDEFNTQFALWDADTSSLAYKALYGISNGKVTWLANQYQSTLPRVPSQSLAVEHYEKWEELASSISSTLPSHLQAFQTHQGWVWMRTSELLVEIALIGLAVSLGLAYIVLLGSTLNLLVATFAFISLVGIAVSAVGFTVALGWDLGFNEAISLTVLAGLAVDYVVHMAIAYIHTPSVFSRQDRVRHGMTEIGVSIVGGASTTLTSMLFTFFALFPFFSRFGTLIFVTIVLSFLYSNFLFNAIASIAGPEGKSGNLYYMFRKCCGGGKKKHQIAAE